MEEGLCFFFLKREAVTSSFRGATKNSSRPTRFQSHCSPFDHWDDKNHAIIIFTGSRLISRLISCLISRFISHLIDSIIVLHRVVADGLAHVHSSSSTTSANICARRVHVIPTLDHPVAHASKVGLTTVSSGLF